MQARAALSNEVARLLRTDRLSGADGGAARGRQPAVVAVSAPRASGAAQAQQYVVRAALTEYRWAERAVMQGIGPGHFEGSELSEVARALFAADPSGAEWDAGARAQAVREEPGHAELISGLLLDETPLSDEGLDNCIAALKRERDQRRRVELKALADAGRLAADDPQWEELRQLLQRMGGRSRRED
jgi:hypothetical protein